MNYFLFIISQICLLISAVYLVITEHYGWAWIPFLVLANRNYHD